MRWAAMLLLPLVLLLLSPLSAAVATPRSHPLPRAGDRFAYAETVLVTNGTGNYTGYSDAGHYNGSIGVTSVAPNATANATYAASGTYSNSLGQRSPWSEGGTFSFSGSTFLYVRGTDNQTGYTNPAVWFYMDASLGRGATFPSLDTPMTVVATNESYPLASSSTGYVATIFAEGNGSYQRHDVYGTFTAVYTWKEFFDPRSGYIVGYVNTETDTDATGDGFSYSDVLRVTSTSYALTPVSAPSGPSSGGSGTGGSSILLLEALAAVVIVVGAVVAAAVVLRRRSPAIPRHPTTPAPGTLPTYAAPPPLHLGVGDQPAVQQVVIRETVKVPCRYCGTLMDPTDAVCPKCGAPRA